VVGWNAAVTVLADVMVTVHVVPLTELQPVQLFRNEPASGVAVRVTVAPFATAALQPEVDPIAQEIPGPVTEPPAPSPVALTVSA